MILDKESLMVTIQCMTYNHEPYIRQCLDGFVMQKTNFRFEAIVHDDASTDRTADIIHEYAEKYPNIIKPIFETENQYSKNDGSLNRIMNEHTHGKYIAICEGDDYWIDPYKLQKQVDFLENNPEYGLVHGEAKVFYQTLNKFRKSPYGSNFSSVDDIIITNKIATLTTCFRAILYFNYIKEIKVQDNWYMGDYPLWLYIAKHSKVYFLPYTIAVYRYLDNSASHNLNIKKRIDFLLSVYSVKIYFIQKYNKFYLLKKCKINSLYNIETSYILANKKVNISYLKQNGFSVTSTFKSFILYLLSINALFRRFYTKRIHNKTIRQQKS